MNATETPVDEPLSIEAILDQLEKAEGKLPEAAIREARRQKDQIIPELIRVLREGADAVRQDREVPRASFFALFLLAEFRAYDALPAILDALSTPGDGPFELFGDAIHENLPGILRSLAREQSIDLSIQLFRNANLNEYVRWAAAKVIVSLGYEETHPREAIVETCRNLLREIMDAKDESVALSALICEMIDLNPKEAAEEIKEAYDRKLVDEFLIDWKTVKDSFEPQPTSPRSQHKPMRYFDDTIKELKTWATFREPKPSPAAAPPIPVERRKPPQPVIPPMPIESRKPPQPVIPPMPTRKPERVGRNDPCPCGSGNKFKRCCGRR